MTRISHRRGLLAVSPLFLLALLFVLLGAFAGGLSKVPLPLVFILASVYALCVYRKGDVGERLRLFSRGAGAPDLLQMVWIFVLAGAFAKTAEQAGCVDATVALTLSALPAQMALCGIFVAACLVSVSVGTSVGTIVALVPVAAGLAAKTGIDAPLVVAAAVGGAFFGDNLSFISDTTIVATQTQGCKLSDKFRANFRIVLPAALITAVIYVFLSPEAHVSSGDETIGWLGVLPYAAVIVLAVSGLNVLIVLLAGNVLAGCVGLISHSLDAGGWLGASSAGIGGMGELIIVSMLAGGLLEMIRQSGGIAYIISILTQRVSTARGAEWSIAVLVALTNVCTANNTVAILSVGKLSRDISQRYGVDRRKAASLLDTFSCVAQSLLPYGAQLLIAAGLSGLSPTDIIPHLYYPFIMCAFAALAIQLRFPRAYSRMVATGRD